MSVCLLNKGDKMISDLISNEEPSELNYKLDAEDFCCLVHGGKLTIEDERINKTLNFILDDIGFLEMSKILDIAWEEFEAKTLNYTNIKHKKIIRDLNKELKKVLAEAMTGKN